MIQTTKNYQIELKNDLLMVKDSNGQLLKAFCVPVWNAVEKFQEMVKRCKEMETKSGK
jgi:hypothetical protein